MARGRPDRVVPDGARQPIVELARAKLNLDLLVTGRTATGYHELDSIVVFADVADRLTFTPADALGLRLEGPFAAGLAADQADNLVLRAARQLAEVAGVEPLVEISLEKNLPVASGIGGGSADAAATLRGLAPFFGLDWPTQALLELGLELGADVPVCVYGRPARLRGIGERLDPVRGLPELPLVLINPGVPVATAAVFQALDLPTDAFRRPVLPAHPSLGRFAVWLAQSRNELEPAALGLAPEIARVLGRLRAIDDCLLARMSGSGATCFGLFADPAKAAVAAARITAAEPGWWCRAAMAAGEGR
jgi:4-diphosphocytidyl-2-C-methyl-D-erythritol kinase